MQSTLRTHPDLLDALEVPQFSAQGTSTTQSFSLVDNAGNSQSLNAIQLANVGFPISFQQIGS